MMRIKSTFLKLLITYLGLLLVSHFISVIAVYGLFQNNLTSLHLNSDCNQMKHLFVLASTISMTITGLFTYYLSKRITAPLREMNQVALQVARGHFEQRVNVRTRDELGELAETFNYMAQALASLDQMRKDFVANVSHDLRSPLTLLHGFVSAFLDDTIPNERKRHYFTLMKEQTERMIKLVNDLLDLARIEAGQLEIRPVSFNLSELVRQIAAHMEPELVKKQINVALIAEEAQDIHVLADPDRIEQVIGNLLQNAVQFSSPDGSVEVILQKTEQAVISIQDYGPGIRPEEIEAIWARFYKADKARTKQAGTGLGLPIVKHLLDLHQSSIDVKSDVGNGSTFTFTLPLAPNMAKKS